MTRTAPAALPLSLALATTMLVVGFAQPAAADGAKSFLGVPRLDIQFTVGMDSADAFVKRRGLGVRGRIMPIRLVGLDVMYLGMPNLFEADYSELTRRFWNASEVVPDISRVLSAFQASVVIAPLFGKLPGPRGKPATEFDWYFTLGGGYVNTEDDAEIISMDQCIGDAYYDNLDGDCWYLVQGHPAWSMGMGLRGVFGGGFVVGLEMRAISYTEHVFSEEGDIDPETGDVILDSYGDPVDYRSQEKKLLWWSLSIGGSIPFRKP
jgi:hypothetical protein